METLNLAETVRLLRESRKWSQEKLGQLIGVSREYIKSIESGATKNPRTDKLLRLAAVLNISKDELFKAAGYVGESKDTYDYQETPQRILDHIKLDILKLEKLIKQKEE